MKGNFKELGYEIHHNVISEELCQLLSIQFEMSKEHYYYNNNLAEDFFIGDSQVKRSYAHYGNYAFESLLILLQPKMEAIVGKKLYPSHTYGRIYYPGADLQPHFDSPNLNTSATLTLSIDKEPWPIYIKDMHDETVEAILPPGSWLAYQGAILTHWRMPYTQGQKQIQVFLHWVEDPYFLYDKRDMLGTPWRGDDPDLIGRGRM